jgi:hypothetical protein
VAARIWMGRNGTDGARGDRAHLVIVHLIAFSDAYGCPLGQSRPSKSASGPPFVRC